MSKHIASLTISCDTCHMRATAACADCVVTHVLSPAPVESVVFDDEEMRVVRLLVKAGMVPTLRHSEIAAVAAFR
jgi:3-hydroxyisobutyrate dehydrogenase-like beta-hydroxyacid dehydrogenase